jgi:hypothetical protein
MRYRVNLTGMNLSGYLRNPVVTLNYGQSVDDVVGNVVKLDELTVVPREQVKRL